MSDYLAVERDEDEYGFTPVDETGNIHILDVVERAGLGTVMIDNSSPNYPVGKVIAQIDTDDYFIVTSGQLGLHSEQFPKFIAEACSAECPFSVTIAPEIQSPIEELAGTPP